MCSCVPKVLLTSDSSAVASQLLPSYEGTCTGSLLLYLRRYFRTFVLSYFRKYFRTFELSYFRKYESTSIKIDRARDCQASPDCSLFILRRYLYKHALGYPTCTVEHRVGLQSNTKSFKLRSSKSTVHVHVFQAPVNYLRRYLRTRLHVHVHVYVQPQLPSKVLSKVLCTSVRKYFRTFEGTFENTSGSTVYSGTRVHVRVQRCTRIIMLYSTVVYFRKYRNIITFVQPNVLKESHSWRARPSRSRKVRNSPKEPRSAFLVT